MMQPEQDRAALVAEKERARAEWFRADDALAKYDRTHPAPEPADATD